TGFTYAMKALQPDKIWLTFDFEPTKGLDADSDDFGEFDYSKLIEAYAKLYLMLKKHGMNPGHFEENHLSQVSKQGQILLQKVRDEIDKLEEKSPQISEQVVSSNEPKEFFKIEPLQLKSQESEFEAWSLQGKRVILAPVSNLTVALSQKEDIANNLVGFIDRDPILQGKEINGAKVYGYQDLNVLEADVVLVAVHQQHQQDITSMLKEHSVKPLHIVLLSQE
ncbi:hypothetical protein LCGC14_1677810, partial [marine sediment metagenome]